MNVVIRRSAQIARENDDATEDADAVGTSPLPVVRMSSSVSSSSSSLLVSTPSSADDDGKKKKKKKAKADDDEGMCVC
jgi:hypothetical protein